jgi:uncharacterized protein YcbK (DUF882 family)
MKHFRLEEFDCSETGENQMDEGFLKRLDNLRDECGFAFIVDSGFRSIKHSKEIVKEKGGTHTQGIAADIRVNGGAQRYMLVEMAIDHGFSGIGVAKTFVHLDLRPDNEVMWVYG